MTRGWDTSESSLLCVLVSGLGIIIEVVLDEKRFVRLKRLLQLARLCVDEPPIHLNAYRDPVAYIRLDCFEFNVAAESGGYVDAP